MTDQLYLGIDLGAESGRVSAGRWNGAQLQLEELHRFSNGAVGIGGTLRWDILRLWAEIQYGLGVAAQRYGESIVSIGVDTWGLDFVLLSRSNELLGLPFHYRDARTRGMMERVFATVPRTTVFAQTGIQFMEINSLYQLVAMREHSPEILQCADCFLTIPDFLNWCLSGARVCEFSNATTTQCLHPLTRDWSREMLDQLGLPSGIFPNVVQPGTNLGRIRKDVAFATELKNVDVIAPATHDTGSAVVAVPLRDHSVYISSGTWSLLGAELPAPVLTEAALRRNFTNEGGVDGTYRLLKNIMGLWIIQQCRRAFEARGQQWSYGDLVRAAAEADPLVSFIDPDDTRFLNPPDMPAAIREFCRETGQVVPDTEAAIARCAFESLALKYAEVLGWLEELTGWEAETVHIVGGGSLNELLNQFTADACERTVIAGPVEATVLGNLLMQVRSRGELASLSQIRDVVRRSGALREYYPVSSNRSAWVQARSRFRGMLTA